MKKHKYVRVWVIEDTECDSEAVWFSAQFALRTRQLAGRITTGPQRPAPQHSRQPFRLPPSRSRPKFAESVSAAVEQEYEGAADGGADAIDLAGAEVATDVREI